MKYQNKKIVFDNIAFDSKKECDRYIYLKSLEGSGIISNLQVHPSFDLLPAQKENSVVRLKTKDKIVLRVLERSVEYSADFSYLKNGELVVEDVKISKYLLPKEYILKRKMLLFFHGVKVKEVFNAKDPV